MNKYLEKPHLLTGPKYSNNLRLWLKKHSHHGAPKVFKLTDGKIFLRLVEYDDGEWLGGLLGHTSTHGPSHYRSLSKETLKDRNPKEIPYFWQMYIDKGICAIDPEHRDYSSRWRVGEPEELSSPNRPKRTCTFCGLTQFRYDWEEVVIEQRTSWR